MRWLGEKRGHLTDWVTQLWVRGTGRRAELARAMWPAGPVGSPRGIGRDFFADLARRDLKESIRVYPSGDDGARADHVLTLWGASFLRLHYRLRARPPASTLAATT